MDEFDRAGAIEKGERSPYSRCWRHWARRSSMGARLGAGIADAGAFAHRPHGAAPRRRAPESPLEDWSCRFERGRRARSAAPRNPSIAHFRGADHDDPPIPAADSLVEERPKPPRSQVTSLTARRKAPIGRERRPGSRIGPCRNLPHNVVRTTANTRARDCGTVTASRPPLKDIMTASPPPNRDALVAALAGARSCSSA